MKFSKIAPGWYGGRCPGCGEEYMAEKRMPRCDDCWPEYERKTRQILADDRLRKALEELASAEAAHTACYQINIAAGPNVERPFPDEAKPKEGTP